MPAYRAEVAVPVCARRAAHTEQPQPAEDDDALDALLDRARALNKQGNYADALDRYLARQGSG